MTQENINKPNSSVTPGSQACYS